MSDDDSLIHDSFPPQGTEQSAAMGSQSVPSPRADPRFERYLTRGSKTVNYPDAQSQLQFKSTSQLKSNIAAAQNSGSSFRQGLSYRGPDF